MGDTIYYIFKWYIRILHDTLLLRKRYICGKENLPKDGERYFIVSNHQNTGNDPLNILFSLPIRIRLCAMARANLFEIKPWITRFLHWVGMVPAFRFGFEGANGIESNFSSFDHVANRINRGFPFVVFPEAGHTQGHYLGRFTSGTVRIAFHAAEQSGWKEDIKILPTASHYSDFFDVQIDYVWKIAPAISLKPYYDEFKQHPASVMRRITHEMHDTVQSMMLDEGAEDYEIKDFLRKTTLNYGRRDLFTLPQQLEKDQAFAAKLNNHPKYSDIISAAKLLKKQISQIGTTEPILMLSPSVPRLMCQAVVLTLFFPLWLFMLWPHALCYSLPLLMLKTDRMFTNTYRYVFSVLLIYPLSALITILVSGLCFGFWWQSIVWVLLWPVTGKLAWYYYAQLKEFKYKCCAFLRPQMCKEALVIRKRIEQLLKDTL